MASTTKTVWSTQAEADLINLRDVEGKQWKDIGVAIDRSVDACRDRYKKLNPDKQSTTKLWSAQAEADLINLRDVEGKQWKDIGVAMDRSLDACRRRYKKLRVDESTKIKWCATDAAILRSRNPRDDKEWNEVATKLNRTVQACKTYWRRNRFHEATKIEKQRSFKVHKRGSKGMSTSLVDGPSSSWHAVKAVYAGFRDSWKGS
ncbi:MAG: hypothetical protein LQ346_001808 [Caloplaca aetnensis]|nr:MAG: hypothetical protein LQ346_001808 [Caloplaca aetnensis]